MWGQTLIIIFHPDVANHGEIVCEGSDTNRYSRMFSINSIFCHCPNIEGDHLKTYTVN